MSTTSIKKSSRIWLNRQSRDPFVKKSKQDGYRSRAAYKLLEIQKKYNILKSGMAVIDLGAAPGSWSQVASEIIFGNSLSPASLTPSLSQRERGELKEGFKVNGGRIISVDLLPIDLIKDVDIIQGDFTDPKIFEQICSLSNGKVDFILSDIAPNLSGIWAVDIPKSRYLSEIVLDLVKSLLKKEGGLLIKVFHGEGFDKYLILLRKYFAKVIICKPKSSRAESREVYVLAKGYYE
ncbi:MAG: RlmE family RNA methyltransferase [Gammaproteobacteria bacterium]